MSCASGIAADGQTPSRCPSGTRTCLPRWTTRTCTRSWLCESLLRPNPPPLRVHSTSSVWHSTVKLTPCSFRGAPGGKGGHDEVARRIALNSQCWVERSEHPSLILIRGSARRARTRNDQGGDHRADGLSMAARRHAGLHVPALPRVRPAGQPRQGQWQDGASHSPPTGYAFLLPQSTMADGVRTSTCSTVPPHRLPRAPTPTRTPHHMLATTYRARSPTRKCRKASRSRSKMRTAQYGGWRLRLQLRASGNEAILACRRRGAQRAAILE